MTRAGLPLEVLAAAVERARKAPFYARKLGAAGLGRGAIVDAERWRAIPPTTKDELRAVERFADDLVIAHSGEIAEFWRSGGVTGRPLFYPRTHADVAASLDAFGTAATVCGVRASDVFFCSLPIGIHPAGQQTVRAVQALGAATVWAGAGNQTPSPTQVELVHELGATVWCGMPAFGLHLAHLAEGMGRPLARSHVRTVITTAEPLAASKRALLERLWGAEVRDMFGMSEVTLMAAECGRSPGLHVWREHSFCEVLDAETLQPVAPGETGVLCVTPLSTGNAVPFLRWLSGDVVRIEEGCDCARRDDPRLIHAGRTLAFLKVKGVNLSHVELEDALYGIGELRDFRVVVTVDDRLRVDVESPDAAAASVLAAVASIFTDRFGVRAEVRTVARGSIAAALEGQIKAQRFVDER